MAARSGENSVPVVAIVSVSMGPSVLTLMCPVTRPDRKSMNAPVAAPSTAKIRPVATPPSKSTRNRTVTRVSAISRHVTGLAPSSAGVPPRLHAADSQPATRLKQRNRAAGTMAARRTSCVLITRSGRPVAFRANVCAVNIASPRRMRTSKGGTTTPSVLATAMVT
jgi:hypothetical protein